MVKWVSDTGLSHSMLPEKESSEMTPPQSKRVWLFLKNFNIELTYDPSTPHEGIYLKD